MGSNPDGDGIAAKVRQAVEHCCRGVVRFSESLDRHFVALDFVRSTDLNLVLSDEKFSK